MFQWYYRLVVLLFLSVLHVGPAAAQPTLAINTSIKPPLSTLEQDGYLDRVLFELFQRAGRNMQIKRMPAERSLHEVASGHSDGDVPRIAGLGAKYPQLLMMPEPVVEYRFSAFAVRPDIVIRSWDDLKKYRVGHIVGWKIFELNIPEQTQVTTANDRFSLFKMLHAGRIDVALHERLLGMSTAKELRIVARPVEPALSRRDMYLYMHYKHRNLLANLSFIFRQMVSDGTLERIAAETLPDGEAFPLGVGQDSAVSHP